MRFHDCHLLFPRGSLFYLLQVRGECTLLSGRQAPPRRSLLTYLEILGYAFVSLINFGIILSHFRHNLFGVVLIGITLDTQIHVAQITVTFLLIPQLRLVKSPLRLSVKMRPFLHLRTACF